MDTESASESEPDPKYLSLQPLTLDLLEVILETMDIKHTREATSIRAGWPEFELQLSVGQAGLLGIRVHDRHAYDVGDLVALVSRCNHWNSTRYFTKASARVVINSPAGTEPQPMARAHVDLDFDAPFGAGLAPIQVQEIIDRVLKNIAEWRSFLRAGFSFQQDTSSA